MKTNLQKKVAKSICALQAKAFYHARKRTEGLSDVIGYIVAKRSGTTSAGSMASSCIDADLEDSDSSDIEDMESSFKPEVKLPTFPPLPARVLKRLWSSSEIEVESSQDPSP